MTWLLCDYGEVLSYAQPAPDWAALVAASGHDDAYFRQMYWAHRPGYDRADVSAEVYWTSVIGAPIGDDHLQELIALDIASWLHVNQASVSAANRAAQRGYRLAILSNAPVELANALEGASWLTGFETRIFSCYLRASKPDPIVYEKVLDRLAAKPEEIVFFDDRLDNVDAASAAGMRAYHFVDPSQLDQLPPV